MTASKNKALQAFKGNHNCSQSVFNGFANRYGVSEDLGLRLCSGFGGGMAMSGDVCGAVAGGVMVLGLNGTGEGESKIETYDKVKQFMSSFEDKFGSLQCRKLVEPRTDENDKRFCDKFVEGATIMIEELLQED